MRGAGKFFEVIDTTEWCKKVVKNGGSDKMKEKKARIKEFDRKLEMLILEELEKEDMDVVEWYYGEAKLKNIIKNVLMETSWWVIMLFFVFLSIFPAAIILLWIVKLMYYLCHTV